MIILQIIKLVDNFTTVLLTVTQALYDLLLYRKIKLLVLIAFLHMKF